MTNDESLDKIAKSLMLNEPFYGLFLVMLNKCWRKDLPTAGVSKLNINYQLAINPDFWETLDELNKYGVLKHELLHIVFHHLFLRNDYQDQEIFNLAADCEINQYINKDWLPEGAILPESFPELNLPPFQGTDFYYNQLLINKNQPCVQSCLEGNDQHPTWSEFDGMDEASQKLLKKQIERVIQEAAESIKKSRGYVPGEISSFLDKIKIDEPPKFDWKGYLRRFTGGSLKVYTKKLRRKLNKRYDENPGLKIKPKRHILVGVDTSGSVSDSELIEFFQELNHIHKTGTDITVVQCDAAISNVAPFNPKAEIKVHGRGGTSFDPVIEMFNQNRKYTALVYFTDGECTTDLKPRGRCLWVLSSTSQINHELPGNIIKLN